MHRTNRQRLFTLLGLLALAALATRAAAQEAPSRTVTGTVRDTSGLPIPFVNIEGPRKLQALGNEEGHFRIVLPAGETTTLILRRLGYEPVSLTVPPGADTSVRVHMTLIAQQLAAVRIVTAAIQTLRNRGFYDRLSARQQGLNAGQFITPEEIELRRPSRPTQLLEGRMSVVVRRVGNCYEITQCYAPAGLNDCAMQVYLDGQRLSARQFRVSGSNTKVGEAPTYIDDLVTPSSIAGIEIYPRGASAPPQYQMLNSTCGVILIWTK